MNEKMKILKMLEDGKITADEAGKLLEALGKEKKDGTTSKVVNSIMDGVSSIVGAIPEAIGGVFSFTEGEEEEIKISKGDELLLKSVGSSIKLSLQDKNEYTIKPKAGIIKTKKENSSITSKIVGGTAEILYPSDLSVRIKDVGGNIDGFGTGIFSIKQMGGSAQLRFDNIKDVNINAKGGTLTLLLGDCDVAFDISAPNGNVQFDIPAEFSEKKEHIVKGTMKKGKGRLVVKAPFCNVSVLPINKKEGK
jgi:DUF4097 and DUF4098 domain-containing protein YvlB